MTVKTIKIMEQVDETECKLSAKKWTEMVNQTRVRMSTALQDAIGTAQVVPGSLIVEAWREPIEQKLIIRALCEVEGDFDVLRLPKGIEVVK